MDCSRCGGDLEVYSLGEREAYVCVDCGFVDTPVEHEIPERSAEPWERALERFYERHRGGDAAIVGSGETAALVEIDSETDESTEGSPDRNQEGEESGDTADRDERDVDDDGGEEPENSGQATEQVQ